MKKLSLSALAERAEAITSEDVLQTISGGTDGDCHVEPDEIRIIRYRGADGRWYERLDGGME